MPTIDDATTQLAKRLPEANDLAAQPISAEEADIGKILNIIKSKQQADAQARQQELQRVQQEKQQAKDFFDTLWAQFIVLCRLLKGNKTTESTIKLNIFEAQADFYKDQLKADWASDAFRRYQEKATKHVVDWDRLNQK